VQELHNPYIEFETGEKLVDPKQIGVTFKYLSRCYPRHKEKKNLSRERIYFSKKLKHKKDPYGAVGRFKTVTIIGVSGAMGSEILKRILREQALPDCEKIQLFGRPKKASQGKDKNFYYALIEKLKDGMDGGLPSIEFVDSFDRVDGELLIMCAGKTIPKDTGKASNRTTLMHENKTIFENCAKSIKENPSRAPEMVIVVSNPNELCTWVFSKYFKRVVAIGPVLDSMRFGREIRDELNLPVEISVDGLVGGNHELRGMLIYKSMLRINCEPPTGEILGNVYPTLKENPDVDEVYNKAYEMVQRGSEGVFNYINSYPIPTRLSVKPLIEYYCGERADFPVGIAVIAIIKAFFSNIRTVVTLTKKTCRGENEICIGVPLFISKNGIEEIDLDSIENFRVYQDDEQLFRAIEVFKSKYSSLT
jgi:malate/lactate dehydrogenase